MAALQWSDYQEDVFDAVAEGEGDLVVLARAGSAKTTTILESLVYVPQSETVLLAAFNKGIERVLVERAPSGVEVRTLHAYGLRSINKSLWNVKIDKNRTRVICRSMYDLERPAVTALCNSVSACKNTLVSEYEDIGDVIYRMNIPFSVEPPDDILTGPQRRRFEWNKEQTLIFIKRTKELLDKSLDVDDAIDMDDMIWLPAVRDDIRTFRYDRVFLDEAQDVNPTQVELLYRAVDRNGIVTVVGDDRQSVYGWRGATLDALRNPKAETLHLPICYRCAKSITRLAQKIVPDIQVWSGAPQGDVVNVQSDDRMLESVKPGDMILSRTNDRLIKLWFRLIALDKPARILGRNIGSGLASFIKGMKATSVIDLLQKTDDWCEVEIKRLKEEKRDTDYVRDFTLCIRAVCQGLSEVSDVLKRIDEIFTQNAEPDRIVLSTVHKAKGLEVPRVFVMLDTFCWRKEREEENLFYVAITRAMRELVLVGDKRDLFRTVEGGTPTPDDWEQRKRRHGGLWGRDLDI